MSNSATYSTLVSLAHSLAGVESALRGLKEQVKELETRREELRKEVLVAMAGEGMKSVNLDGIGRLAVHTRKLYQIQDIDLLTRQMLSEIVKAGKEGRPLSDGLLLQKRLHNENFETYLGGGDPATWGVMSMDKTDITFTPVKTSSK